MLDIECTQHMTGDQRIFNLLIQVARMNLILSHLMTTNGKGMVKGLGRIAISNDMIISNVCVTSRESRFQFAIGGTAL